MISALQAAILGAVEGLTEFLPVSSTGHLILVSRFLGLRGEAVNSFEVVIQAGALAAVLGLYRTRIRQIIHGIRGEHPAGWSLFVNLMISFFPAAVAGLMLHRRIKEHLFSAWPVVMALAAGGVLMVAVDYWAKRRDEIPDRTVDTLSPIEALLIGLAQCLALWPGTSRAMVTMVAALLCGLPAAAAAEYSFLLALPTLGAAVVLDGVTGAEGLWRQTQGGSLAVGLLTAWVVAALAIRGFVRYLGRHGIGVFGWYRIALAAAVWYFVLRPAS